MCAVVTDWVWIKHKLQQTKRLWQETEYHPNQYLHFQENGHQSFWFLLKTVNLNEGKGHPNWYQNVDLSGLYHHTKFERNQSVNVWQANVKEFVGFFFMKSQKYGSFAWILNGQDKMSMRFSKLASLNCMRNSIQINWQLSEIIDVEVCRFLALLWPWFKIKVN